MSENSPLGAPRRTRRVTDQSRVVMPHAIEHPRLVVREINLGARHDDLGSGCGENPAGAIGVVDQRRPGTGVSHDVCDLALAIRRVGGHDDDARAKRRHMSDDQLERGLGAEQHPVSRLEPCPLQPTSHSTRRFLQLLCVDPAAIAIEQRRRGRSGTARG